MAMSNGICPLIAQQKLSEDRGRQMILSSLNEQETQLKAVKEDLDRLEKEVEKLRADRDAIQHRVDVNRSLLAPISALPAEVLGMIFFEYASDPDNRSPHVLALVCRRWRDVMHGTPAAWSFLYLAVNNADFPLEVYLGYLNQVGRCSLSVTVDLTNAGDLDDNLSWAEWLRDRLLPYSLSRLEITNRDYGTPFQALLPLFELLYTDKSKNQIGTFLIHFECTDTDISDASATAASQALATTSKLTEISVPLDLLHSSEPLLKQLVHLRLLLSSHSLVRSRRLEAVLRGCPLLESLTLGNGFPRSQSATVTLPNLNHLRVSSNDCLPRIFNTLRTPNLRKLTLDQIEGYTSDVGDGIKAFVRQGGSEARPRPPPLTHLTLNKVNCPERTLVWTLRRIDTLQVLRITDDIKVRTLLIDALVEPPAPRRGWFCPRLRIIELEKCEKLKESQIRALIRARPLVAETQWRWGMLQRLTVNGTEYNGSQN